MRRRHEDSRQAAERVWLNAPGSRGASALDLMLAAPVFAASSHVHPGRVAWLLRQVATASASGVPLAAVLDMLAGSQADTPAGDLCSALAGSVARGDSLSGALAAHPETFNGTTVALVRSGERLGDLPRGLESAATILEEDAAAVARVRRAFTYPLVSAAVIAALIGALMFAVTPVLSAIDTGTGLPTMTRILLDAAQYAPWLLVPAGVAAVALRTALRIPRAAAIVRRRVDALLVRIPGFAQLTRQRAHARLAGVVAWALTAGTSTSEALRLAAASTGNAEFESAALRAADLISSSGSSLVEALAGEPHLAELAPLALTGEATGSLPALFRGYATTTADDADETARSLEAAAEPLSAAAAGIVLLAWLLGVFLPVIHASAGIG